MTNKKINPFHTKSFAQKVVFIMLCILAVLLVCALIVVSVLLAWSPGKVEPFLDKNGEMLKDSIAEKTSVEINDTMQGMIIRGKNINNPVLLIVHGGPGMPDYFFNTDYPTELEDYFTVCWWDQRGGGLSYSSDMNTDTLTSKQLVSDTIGVTNYLRERFGQEKIYLMGHSWGTYLGIQAAARSPELYHAYIGMSQVSQQIKSEKLAYEYMLEQYKSAGNKKMVKKLEAFPITESDTAFHSYQASFLRDEAMHDLGIGTMHNMKSVVTGIFLSVMQCRAYTLGEKINIWRGKAFLNKFTELRNQMHSTDLTDLTVEVPQLDIPVYFFSGIHDYTVSYSLTAQYFEQLQAPKKGFYTFEESAHSPLFEEPEKFILIMQEDVLNGTTNLADTK